jgi:hypothetical protein
LILVAIIHHSGEDSARQSGPLAGRYIEVRFRKSSTSILMRWWVAARKVAGRKRWRVDVDATACEICSYQRPAARRTDAPCPRCLTGASFSTLFQPQKSFQSLR